MGDSLDWEHDGRTWPHRTASQFVTAGGIRWHVQRMGEGPTVLLLHGTGAATHSWAGLMPLLAEHFTVIAPDLPGHGFSGAPVAGRLSLPGMAGAIADLVRALGVEPALAVGHSAGAAILARMALDGRIHPQALVAINGAFQAFRGLAGHIFSPLAKLLALNPLVPRLFSWQAGDRGFVEKLLRDTGSRIDRRMLDSYARLAAHPGHVSAALQMMAAWNLRPLEQALPRLNVPLVLLVGLDDRTVPPEQAEAVARLVPGARIERFPRLGHLAHEEAPEAIAAAILRTAHDVGIVPGGP